MDTHVVIENIAEYMRGELGLDDVGYDSRSVWWTGDDHVRHTLLVDPVLR